MGKRIFDCFTFFNELDLLELRLNELHEQVDFFVIAESPVTFQGQKKPLFFAENRQRFAAFAEKIIHLVVADMPATNNPWEREHFQRNALRRGLRQASPDDIIIIGDADEIVSQDAMDILRVTTGFTQINMPMYQYYMNLREQHGWNKVFAYTFGLQDQVPDFNWVRTSQNEAFALFAGRNRKLFNAGWHFTYLGGPETIRRKLQAFSHTESWFRHMLTPGGAEVQITAGYEVGNSWNFVRYCPIDATFPLYLQNNLQKYLDLGFVKDPYVALQEMQMLIRNCHETIRQDRERMHFYETFYRNAAAPRLDDVSKL
jgi:hypothetical protein